MIIHVYPIDLIRDRLNRHDPESFSVGADTRQAAVAVILRPGTHGGGGNGTDILFIKRAEKPGDPWSGHMAFPGGHREKVDAESRLGSSGGSMPGMQHGANESQAPAPAPAPESGDDH